MLYTIPYGYSVFRSLAILAIKLIYVYKFMFCTQRLCLRLRGSMYGARRLFNQKTVLFFFLSSACFRLFFSHSTFFCTLPQVKRHQSVSRVGKVGHKHFPGVKTIKGSTNVGGGGGFSLRLSLRFPGSLVSVCVQPCYVRKCESRGDSCSLTRSHFISFCVPRVFLADQLNDHS